MRGWFEDGGSKILMKSKICCLSRIAEQEPNDERQQKTREIQKPMPFKICRTSAFAPKAAKNPRNPQIVAFQELRNKSLRMKGSKKPEKFKNRCFLRFVGQVPSHQRQQKTQEIRKLLLFKICRTSAFAPKAAKNPRNPKTDAFQDLSDKRPRTKGSKKPKKFKNRCLLRIEG